MKNTDPKLYQHTPTVSVYDNRGLTIRNIDFHRTVAGGDTDIRITRHQYDARGHLSQSIDPRLYDAKQTDNSINPNFLWQYNLTGDTLRTESADAGRIVALNDIEGRQVLIVTATGVTQTRQYEANTLPGRLLSVSEQAPEEKAPRVTEYLIWASNTQAEKDHNLAGQYVRHYDTAGVTQLKSLSLTENILSQSCKLLADGQEADWMGNDETLWQTKFNNETYTTQSTFDATGALLTQTDATGNIQRLAYNVAGQLKGSWLTLKNQSEQVIIKSLTYSAAGQKLLEEHGNGVITEYRYEPETLRLISTTTRRQSDNKVLQDLRYEHDPVGNIISVRNDAEATRFWRNQKIVPENVYTYDSLYQLINATGREMANIGQQNNQLPSLIIPLPTDDSSYTNYTRNYNYDRGGNLVQIRHSSPATQNNYTTDITVSNRSNRAVLSSLTTDSTQVDTLFDAGGHQRKLLPGQDLSWNARGELQQVTPVSRENASDREWYRYGNDGMRQLKVSEQQAGNNTQQQRVTYLPGLELRTTQSGTTISEDLHVITVGAAGHAQVRVLHWETTPPAGISNNQLRYSYDNLIGSSQLELDNEGQIISQEEYYPFGGTALWAARNQIEASYKILRYSGKERDATGLYYYGYRYYQPWVGRWLSADPAGTVDGLNLYRMVKNNPSTLIDISGLNSETHKIFGFNIQIDNPEEEWESTQIRVKNKFLNFGSVDTLTAERKYGLNVPEELFDRQIEKDESILTFKKNLPISCISSTEYTLDILYNKNETKPFPYESEATIGADLGVIMSVEFGNKSIENASDIDLKEDVLPLRKSTDKTVLPDLKQGLMIAEKVTSKGKAYPFHFGAAIAVVYDKEKKVAASILTDLSEPEREEGAHLQSSQTVNAMFIKNVNEFRGDDYPESKYSIGLVKAEKRQPVVTKKRALPEDAPSSSRNKKLHVH
ncbi:RHS repeat domain-containing protein [Photorhabdus sp. P32]|uniref:RHS repeat domain-containing protein n=1 Tax=Photorhabdus sp. P32 TaxID=3117549 RepID=UPI00311AC4A2